MNHCKIIFRSSLTSKEELLAASRYFKCVSQRTEIGNGDLVIGRYSIWPFYKEFENDVLALGGHLINTYKEHLYVSDLGNWYEDLKEVTPKTWTSLEDVTDNDGPFVLKGETNSYKSKWSSHAFAKNKKEAIQVMFNLFDDRFLMGQNLYIRKYIPLQRICDGIGGIPISEEYRFFVLDGKILCSGFYWSDVIEDIPDNISSSKVPKEFLKKVIDLVGTHIRFYVIDVALTSVGEWIVIELNDGQYSGLCGCDQQSLYENLCSMFLSL